MTEFILKSIYLNLLLKSTAIGTNFLNLCLWLRYVDNKFFIRRKDEDKLEGFLNCLENFYPNLKFTHEKSKSSVNFLDASVSIVDNKLETGKIAVSLSTLILLTHSLISKQKSVVYRHGLRIISINFPKNSLKI